MKKLILLMITCALTLTNSAQVNLVRNGSFEKDTSCPLPYHEGYFAPPWTGIDSSWTVDSPYLFPSGYCAPNYINGCSPYLESSEPDNANFYHYPRTGNGMMLLFLYVNNPSDSLRLQREYLQQWLSARLVAGQSYCVTFFVVNAHRSNYAINHIGAYFDDGSMDTVSHCAYPLMEYTPPQILDTGIINDTLNWVKIQGSFIANGTENFITIGNFYDSAHTQTLLVRHAGATDEVGYLFDDVSVIPSDSVADAGPDKGIGQGDSTWIGVDSNGDGMPC